MKFKPIITLVVAALLILLAGFLARPLILRMSTPREVSLQMKDSGREIRMVRDQALSIILEANPSTGYTWEVAEIDEKVLRRVGEIEFEPESELIGASGKQILRFEATGKGECTLKLVYHRPWEKEVEPAETFSVKVTVR